MKLSTILLATAALTGTALADEPTPPDGGGGAGVGAEVGAEVSVGPDGQPIAANVTVGVGVYTKATWPVSFNARPLTLAKGMVEIQGDALINLSSDRVFKPFAIAPDIYYGVSDKLSVGLTHGVGLCLTGESNGCGKVYNDVGLDAIFSLSLKENMQIAAHGGLDFSALDPFTLALRIGALIKFTSGKITIFADPFISIGITEREPDAMAMVALANKEAIGIPVTVSFQANEKLNAFARLNFGGLSASNPTGGAAPFDGLGDFYAIGLSVGALFAVSNKLDVGGEIVLPFLVGGFDEGTGVDARVIVLSANYRL